MKKYVLNKILSKSNQFKYYKENYLKLENENKQLIDEINNYKKVYPVKECPICGYKGINFRPYPGIIHKEVSCPQCGSHERHRAAWLYLKDKPYLYSDGSRILHFAPEKVLYDLFKSNKTEYHPVDISLDNPLVEEKMDIQNISFEDNYFDLIYCSHVLEHVPNDKKALNELFRVLKPKGTALIMVPINGVCYDLPFDDELTHESESINTPELREKYYGQSDHLRLYGRDFKNKLHESGFTVISDDFIKKLGIDTIEKYALIRNESLFECTK